MKYVYYVLCTKDLYVEGPYPFKEAVIVRNGLDEPATILKEVVDENGKEVK